MIVLNVHGEGTGSAQCGLIKHKAIPVAGHVLIANQHIRIAAALQIAQRRFA
ncbi:hypothetical protein [Cognatiyoonia sediminum]|uniref:hypothetical protein n=1 Tax=Cognatiyoonia sediminum TaxID=1508389 RepID=UPI001F61E5FE|nr:hypothetical protein [Cognatiyoonia sediminum]